MSGAMNVIYKKKNFKIYDAGNGFIVHNSNLDFGDHYTHINNFDTCKYIIDLSIHKSIPKHLSDYLLESLIRLSNDKKYINKIKLCMTSKKKNTNNYKQRYNNEKHKSKNFTKYPKTYKKNYDS